MPGRRRWVRALLDRSGYDVQRVHDGAWLVQRSRGAGDEKQQRRVRDALEARFADEHLAWVLDKLRIDCVLDVGANRGQFARRLRALGYTGRIASFEPVSHLLAGLRTAAAADPAWTVHPYALGDQDGQAEINVVPGKLSSMLAPSEFGRQWAAKLRDAHTETIEVRRLDGVWHEATAGLAEPRVLLKLDTQGYDLLAFRGAGDRRADLLALQSELACVPIYEGMPRMPEQLSEYEAAGLAISAMQPVNRHRASMRVVELDVLMVRAGSTPPR